MLRRLSRQLWHYARLARLSWLDESAGIAACRYPRTSRALADLTDRGIVVLLNLHARPHPPELLVQYGLTEVHDPVPDFTAPTPAQLARAVRLIEDSVDRGQRIAVHCGAGLGRTGTVLACYLVARGASPPEAIARVRAVRPGSIETASQEAAIAQFARGRPGSTVG